MRRCGIDDDYRAEAPPTPRGKQHALQDTSYVTSNRRSIACQWLLRQGHSHTGSGRSAEQRRLRFHSERQLDHLVPTQFGQDELCTTGLALEWNGCPRRHRAHGANWLKSHDGYWEIIHRDGFLDGIELGSASFRDVMEQVDYPAPL